MLPPVALPLESVPNVSEGRDPAAIEAIGEAFSGSARLLDVHSDPDHHRSVYTLVGDDDALVESLVAGVARALELVDLRAHAGAHPRVGAVDVVPLVPLRPEDEPRARAAALALADRLAGLDLPVLFYGRLTQDGREPAFFRRGGTEELERRLASGELVPDRGPNRLHPTAGVVLVGVRRPLIAFNVNLRSADVEAARAIARLVRERDGGFPGVRALGLALPQAGLVQVSMNVTDWEAAALHEIVAAIAAAAAERVVEVVGSELVGLMPAGAAVEAAGASFGIEGFDRRHVLELRLLDE
jgi:glutamate formiminotransferase/glutamate formiminotransferase/formiminotetrahydrofolate cyclodeaminase